MKIVYIDESGDTSPISQGGSKFFVLTACIVDEIDRKEIEDDLRKIKKEFYQNPDIEFKSNFIRYANPDLPNYDSVLKLNSRERYDDLEEKLSEFLKKAPVCIISVVIDKEYYWKRYPSQNPYDAGYIFLMERVQKELANSNSLGIVIIDPRDGRVEKQLIGDDLERIHHLMRFNQIYESYTQTPNIVERLLYSDSKNTIGIQIADLYCYPVFHIFEYNKNPEDYWRYNELTYPKFRKSPGGKVLGWGLKIFMDTTKKDPEEGS